MKAREFIFAAMALAMVVSCSRRSEVTSEEQALADSLGLSVPKTVRAPLPPKNPKAYLPKKALTDSTSYLIGVQFGAFLKQYNFGTDLNYGRIKQGINDFYNAKGNMRDSAFAAQFKVSPEKMNDIFTSFTGKRHEYTVAVNTKKEEKFLAENLKKDGVQATESGLQYVIVEPGDTVRATGRDTIYVQYKGTLEDGTVFDESKEGVSSRLFLNRVVKGWQEGLGLIGQGGRINLVVPSALAYGANGNQTIEPMTPLIFEVQLDSVKHYVKPAPKEPATKKK